jgi:glycosyltransferase involved in cell wall biosynthesis
MVEAPSAPNVFGLPVVDAEAHLPQSIESLLAQTRTDFRIAVVDDCSTDRTLEIAHRYAEFDSRVSVHTNSERLGLVGNWRRALQCALEDAPDAVNFAWASDHDIWHESWLEILAAELDAHPEAVLAFPLALRITEGGADAGLRPRVSDTTGLHEPAERLRTFIHRVKAGDAIYGLIRVEPLLRCGPLPFVGSPDRLLLTRLALEGEFRQVPRLLWSRRYRQGIRASAARQRRTFYPRGAPPWAYVPWPIAHSILFRRSARAGDLEPDSLARLQFQETLRFASADWLNQRLRKLRRGREARIRRWRKRYARLSRSLPAPIRSLGRPFVRLIRRAIRSEAIHR